MTVRFTQRPIINLSRGWPHPSLHPTATLSEASKAVLHSPALSEPALGYGPDEGDPSLRAEIARWLTAFYQPREAVDAGRIVISGGASQNLACVLQVFSDPVYTRNVWAGVTDVFIFAIMSVRRRTQLVRLARQYDALVVTDDVYDFLQWHIDPSSTQPQLTTAVAPRLVDIDRFLDGGPRDEFGNCMSNGSFSKLLGPGCRVGWVEGTEKFVYGVGQTGSTRSGGAPSQLTSTFICQMLSSGFIQSYIPEVLCPAYSKRYHILRTAIEKHLHPLGMTFTKPLSPSSLSGSSDKITPSEISGGYFFWLRLPSGISANRVTRIAAEELNLRAAAGEGSKVTGEGAKPDYDYADADEPLDSFVRICLAYVDEDMLEEGVQRLAQAVEKAKQDIGC
ncbi:aminotransferase [Trichophyton tonsurans CBS 112818]|uniref:Aminotransferase n=1 Tax=Trichophyton tonsurans (strain CBS 112818) TaxID=647933 RepID=F2S1J3_TRIT1|nr:aminotransferase [Trichophyton tonsurans CBS 112818]